MFLVAIVSANPLRKGGRGVYRESGQCDFSRFLMQFLSGEGVAPGFPMVLQSSARDRHLEPHPVEERNLRGMACRPWKPAGGEEKALA